MVTFLVSVKLNCVGHQLFIGDCFECKEIRLILVVIITSLILPTVREESIRSVGSAHGRANSSIRDSR
jgi:hypothetical protein